MSIAWGALLWGVVTLSFEIALLFSCIRAYRRSGERGFLLLATALVILPLLSHLTRGPLLDWVHDRGWSAQEYGLLNLVQLSLKMTLLSAALILLARPLHRGRRA